MSDHPERTPAPIPQELVDTFFDRELDEGSREKFFGMLRGDLSRCAEVARTQRMISMLREPVEAPDLTDRIMARVARRRGFLPERVRRMVTAGRLIAAACVLAAVLGLAAARRMAPDAFRLTPVPRPLSDVIASSKADAASGVQHMAAVVAIQIPGTTGDGRGAATRGHRPMMALTPGRTSVRTLAEAKGPDLAVPRGAGGEARFVFIGGECVDRATAARVWVGAGPLGTDGAICPEAIEQFIVRLMQGASSSSGPSAAGQRAIEAP